MKITVNGTSHQIENGTTVTDLLELLDFPKQLIAVERNREIIPQKLHAITPIAEGDTFEIVTFVGGG